MAKIRIRRGIESKLPLLDEGEFGFTTDTKKLYIGASSGNQLLINTSDVSGDMFKSIYDTDNDGIVDQAEKVDWSGVQNKPSTFAPSNHTHDDRYYTETEANNKFAPSGYGLGVALSGVTASNSNNTLTTGMYYASSSDPNKPAGVQDGGLFVMAYSDIWITQLYFDWRTNKTYKRVCSNGVWSSWDTLMTNNVASTWNNLKGV